VKANGHAIRHTTRRRAVGLSRPVIASRVWPRSAASQVGSASIHSRNCVPERSAVGGSDHVPGASAGVEAGNTQVPTLDAGRPARRVEQPQDRRRVEGSAARAGRDRCRTRSRHHRPDQQAVALLRLQGPASSRSRGIAGTPPTVALSPSKASTDGRSTPSVRVPRIARRPTIMAGWPWRELTRRTPRPARRARPEPRPLPATPSSAAAARDVTGHAGDPTRRPHPRAPQWRYEHAPTRPPTSKRPPASHATPAHGTHAAHRGPPTEPSRAMTDVLSTLLHPVADVLDLGPALRRPGIGSPSRSAVQLPAGRDRGPEQHRRPPEVQGPVSTHVEIRSEQTPR
jgi:hypothetical protein